MWGLELYRLESYVLVVAVRTAASSGAATIAFAAVAIIAAIRVDRQVEVNVGLALLDGLQHGSLSPAASHEVELGVVE